MAWEYARLSAADIGVLAAYFGLIVLIGIYAAVRSDRSTLSGYFLAGRNMWFLPVAASLFVSNIGARHLIGLAGSGAARGISVGAWEFNAVVLLVLLGWVFIPVYIACGVYTMPDYLALRFGGERLRMIATIFSLLTAILLYCSGSLFTGALFMQQSLNWDLYVSCIALILLTGILTITGGLTAVIYTDTLQAFLIVAGSTYLTIAGFAEIGGFSGLLEKYPQAVPTNVSAIVVNTTCHWPDRQSFRMLRAIDDDYTPWLGFLVGQLPKAVWFWCSSQLIVQRALAAKSLSHAQAATLTTSLVKFTPLFVMVIPGMISRILYPDEVACTNPDYCYEVCQSRSGCTNIAFPRLVLGLMPDGARGLMMAVMIAALMSDLDSVFNSASAVFTLDIWWRFRKNATQKELMVVGRVFVLIFVAVSVAWVPVIKERTGSEFFMYIVRTTSYLAPPFSAVYLMGVFVPRVNEKGAFWALILGSAVGLTRMGVELAYGEETYCGQTARNKPEILVKLDYTYFAVFLTPFTALAAFLISLCSERPHPSQLHRTTYWTRHDELKRTESDLEMSSEEGPRVQKPDIENGDAAQAVIEYNNFKAPVANGSPDAVDGEGNVDQQTGGDSSSDAAERGNRIVNYIINLLCGVRGDSQKKRENEAALRQHMKELAKMKQRTSTKVLLHIGMVLVLILGLGQDVFWSVYPFPTGPFYPQGAENVLPGDEQLLKHMTPAE